MTEKLIDIQIAVSGSLRGQAGTREFSLSVREASCLLDVLNLLREEYGLNIQDGDHEYQWRYHAGHVSVLVNGREIRPPEWPGVKISQGDVLVIFPPLAGG